MPEWKLVLVSIIFIGWLIHFFIIDSQEKEKRKNRTNYGIKRNSNVTNKTSFGNDTNYQIRPNATFQSKSNTNSKPKMTENISTTKLDYYISFLMDRQIYSGNSFLKRNSFTIPMEIEINIRTNKDNLKIYDSHLRELLNFMLLYVGLPYARC